MLQTHETKAVSYSTAKTVTDVLGVCGFCASVLLLPHWSVKGLVLGWHADVVQLVLCCNIKSVWGVTIRPHIPDQHFISFCLNA